MKIPKGKFIKTYPDKSEYRTVTEQVMNDKFDGYLLVSTPIKNIDAKGSLVFEGGVPVLAYYEHKGVLNCTHALKNIARNFSKSRSVVELHELTKHQIGICKMYDSYVNKHKASTIALDIYDGVETSPDSVDELSCEKAGGDMPKESMCNICKKQCISSIAEPTHIIAKRFIKNRSVVLKNRDMINGISTTSQVSKPIRTIEPEQSINVNVKPESSVEFSANDDLEAFLKESVNSFKDQSEMILESIGLGHMKKQ